ncbi:MAG: hypothetical protein JO115_05620 [Pseudonocardiales bacterium]|nr:hypothetical protein [Pseudonocardiales bacterium]
MSQTPIYDQLRGERINADVPATGDEPQRASHPGKPSHPTTVSRLETHGLPADAANVVVAFDPIPAAEPDPSQPAATWGPRAPLPPTTHARSTRANPQRRPAPPTRPQLTS